MNARSMRGFSMIEVLVSLVIISVGLLGIAKIQLLAYSETNTASLRSIAAIEAASMASSMRANRTYWATGASLNPANLTFNITGPTVTSSDPAMPPSPDCAVPGTPCTTTDMAAYDVMQWATALNSVLGASAAPTAVIDCPTTITPINCTISVTWTERMMAGGGAGNVAAVGAVITPTYTLYVQP